MTSPKLKSLAEMAKRGLGNERENAEKLLRKLCEKNNLDYDSVLNDILIEEFEFKTFKTGVDKMVAVHTMAKFAMLPGDSSYYANKFAVSLKTTREKWSLFLTAMSQVAALYKKQRKEMLARHRKERSVFVESFIRRHELFYPYPQTVEPAQKKKRTKAQEERARAMVRLMNDLDEELDIKLQIENVGET